MQNDDQIAQSSKANGENNSPQGAFWTPLILLVSLVLYLSSWGTPCIVMSGTDGICPGWKCAYMGFFGFLLGHFELLANVAYMVSVPFFFFGLYIPAVILSSLALALGLETLTLYTFGVPLDEGGAKHFLVELLPGYHMWMGSMLLIALYSTRELIMRRSVQD